MLYKLKNYTPHPGQRAFHDATKKQVIVVSPIRSGKTFSLLRDIAVSAWNNKTGFGILCCAPINQMLKTVIERPAVDLLSGMGILKEHKYSEHLSILKNGNKIYYRALESYDRVRGLDVSKAYVDEVCMCSREALDVVKGRLLTTNGQLKMITSPLGTGNFIYEDYFKEQNEAVDYIYYNLRDNPLITEEGIQELKGMYDPLLAQQELEGKWVNVCENLVYYSFSENNIQPTKYNPNLPVYIGLDFNINKNAWIGLQRYKDNTFHAFIEGYGAKTTEDVAKQILNAIPQHPIVIPDATGQNNLQGFAVSQVQLLRQAGMMSVQTPRKSNPARSLRYALVNGALQNGLNQNRLVLDPEGCKETIKELATLSYKKDSDKPNDNNNKIGHRTDALGYCIAYLDSNRISRKI